MSEQIGSNWGWEAPPTSTAPAVDAIAALAGNLFSSDALAEAFAATGGLPNADAVHGEILTAMKIAGGSAK